MKIAEIELKLERSGDRATLRLVARPFAHETPITLEELTRLVSEFAQAVKEWERARHGNFYAVLGVARDASDEEIQCAYRTRAKQCHPDTSAGDTAAMQHLNEAYAVVGDPQQRQQYDDHLTK